MPQLPTGDEESEIRSNVDRKAGRLAEARRTILFVAPGGTISDSLAHAVERELPAISVELAETVQEALRTFSHPVSLILFDGLLVGAIGQASSELRRLHPQAAVGVIQRDGSSPPHLLSEILSLPLIRGVLPMNVGLDIWLSVIRLMLCGGEYIPTAMYHNSTLRAGDVHLWMPGGAVASTGRPDGSSHMAELTAREVQILEMVSRGWQNKTIAAEFRLSENTVKIHLHNIISKLGAHNRTEAAAKFRRLQRRNGEIAGNGSWPET
jgi:DNA-binding NarL/FixJ family response regulator